MAGEPRDRRWAVLAILTTGMFVVMLDSTVVNIAMAHIMRAFDADIAAVQWIINAYVLAFACTLITFGRLGDLVGRKRIFLLGLALFTGASLACAFAPSVGWLVAMRAAQGLGGAMMLPSTLSIAASIFPADERGKAIGVWAGVNGLATALGPTIGGLVIDNASWAPLFGGASWPFVFLVNVPLGVALLIVGAKVMPESADRSSRHRLDGRGVVVLTASLVCLTYGLIEGAHAGWGDPGIVALFAAAGLGLLAFVMVERRVPEPLLPLSAFRSRTFTAANLTGLVMSFGLAGGLFLLPLFFQLVFGYSAVKTGLLLTPLSGGLFLGAPVAGRLSDRFGSRWLAFSGMLIAAAGLLWLQAPMALTVGWQSLIGPLFVAGFGIGFVVAPVAASVIGTSPEGAMGASSGVYTTMRQFGALLAVAVMGAVLQSRTASAIADSALERLQGVPGLPDGLAVRLADAMGEAGRDLGGGAAWIDGIGRHLAGLPPETAAAVRELLAQPAFVLDGVVDAMQATVTFSAVVLASGALIALAIGRSRTASSESLAEIPGDGSPERTVPAATGRPQGAGKDRALVT